MCIDLWEEGRYQGLVDDPLAESRTRGRRNSMEEGAEARGHRFNTTVLSGKLRTAVCIVTDRGGGGVFRPDDPCSKTGRPVLDVIRE